MTPIAIAFLVLSIALVWGGLAVSTFLLVRTSNQPDDPAAVTSSDHVPPRERTT